MLLPQYIKPNQREKECNNCYIWIIGQKNLRELAQKVANLLKDGKSIQEIAGKDFFVLWILDSGVKSSHDL